MVTTDQVIEQSAPSDDRALVRDFLMREDVRQQLTQLGVDPEEAARRIASLSDEEVPQIAGRLDELPAGEGAVGIVIGAHPSQSASLSHRHIRVRRPGGDAERS